MFMFSMKMTLPNQVKLTHENVKPNIFHKLTSMKRFSLDFHSIYDRMTVVNHLLEVFYREN